MPAKSVKKKTSKKATTNKAPRRQRDAKLIDTDHPEDKPLIEAAEAYRDVRDERQALNKAEKELKDALIAMMHERKLETYRHEELLIELVHKDESVKVRTVKEDEDAEAETGDDE